MTILKLTKSKKAVQIIDDEGHVYITSVNSVLYLLKGLAKGSFITTKRLPFDVAKDRFKPSELYDPDGVFTGNASKTLTTTNDAISQKVLKGNEVKKAFVDKNVW